MATQSFNEMMEVDTAEKAKNLVKAFEVAEKRGPLETDGSFFEMQEAGREYLRSRSQ